MVIGDEVMLGAILMEEMDVLVHQPDKRSIQICKENGVNISHQQARQLSSADGHFYDYILAMDNSNIENIKGIIDSENHHKIHRFDSLEIDDPYFGEDDGFSVMYQHINTASMHWLAVLNEYYALSPKDRKRSKRG